MKTFGKENARVPSSAALKLKATVMPARGRDLNRERRSF